jgi:hypothetical protein
VALPRRMLLLAMAALMALMLMALWQVLAAPTTEDGVGGLRVAEARPAIGTSPPGTGSRNPNADINNPGVDNRTEPRTGGQSPHFQDEGCVREQPAHFCEQP